jgi:hypothetical protein
VFLECKTYRWREHCGHGFDNHIGYRTEAEFLAWQERDPIATLERQLEAEGGFDAQLLELFRGGVRSEIVQAFAAAARSMTPFGNPDLASSFTPAELNRIIRQMDKRGWQIMTHAIGDAGVRMTLDAYEAAAASSPAPARGRRHRIEHIETVDAADIPRFGALGVIASQEPYHGTPTPNQIEVWAGNIGPDRASRAWVWKSIKDAGGRLAFGSDWPVVTLDPRVGLNMAVNRTTNDGKPEGGWLPEQKLTIPEAIDAYTSGAAYASFDEQRKGTLSPGMLADIVILSGDIFAAPPERLLDAVVDVTVFDGKVVYSREATALTDAN